MSWGRVCNVTHDDEILARPITFFLPSIKILSPRFKMKYHPSERERENYKKLVRQRQRLHIFMEIFNKEILARGGLDASSAPDLMKIMDTSEFEFNGVCSQKWYWPIGKTVIAHIQATFK